MKNSGAILLLILALLSSCGDGGQRPIPRPKAYPRLDLPDTVMHISQASPLILETNAAAAASSPRPGWLNVAYPTLGATLHITVTPVSTSSAEATIQNRMERMMLNSGDRPSRQSEFTTPAGFRALVSETEGIATPVQFLATDDSAWVISGAAYFARPGAPEAADSLRPAVAALRRDVITTIMRLREP